MKTLLLALSLASGLLAQTFTGTFRGNVVDPTGAMIPNVKISIREVDTGVERTTVSNDAGWYEMPLLPPGRYQLEANHAGFQKYVRSSMRLDVNQHVDLQIEMKVGDTSQVMEVLGE